MTRGWIACSGDGSNSRLVHGSVSQCSARRVTADCLATFGDSGAHPWQHGSLTVRRTRRRLSRMANG